MLNSLEGSGESPECRMGPSMSHQEGPSLCTEACCLKLLCNFLHIPASLSLVSQQVVNKAWAEGSGHALHHQLGVEEQGEYFSITSGIINLQRKRSSK